MARAWDSNRLLRAGPICAALVRMASCVYICVYVFYFLNRRWIYPSPFLLRSDWTRDENVRAPYVRAFGCRLCLANWSSFILHLFEGERKKKGESTKAGKGGLGVKMESRRDTGKWVGAVNG